MIGSRASDGLTRSDSAIGRASAACVSFACTRSLIVVAVASVLVAVALLYAAAHLGVDSDTSAMLSEELPFRRVTRQLQAAFPQLDEPLVIVIDGDTPEHTRDAAAALADRLTQRSDLFRAVFAPGVGSFFETNGLLYADAETLERFSDRMVAVLPFVGEIVREPTLRKLLELVNRSLDPQSPHAVGGDGLHDMLDAIADVLEAPLSAPGHPFSWSTWLLGDTGGDDATRRVIIASPVLEFDDLKAARRPIAAVRRIARELGQTPDAGITVRITGDPALGADEMDMVVRQAGMVAVGISFLSVSALLLISLRSLRLALVTVLTLLCGLAWTTGFAALAIGHLNLISTAFAVLFIGLAVDFGIHFSLHYQELRGNGEHPRAALVDTGRDVGSSIVLCATTTAIGFYAFVPTRYAGVAELGIISGTGMFLSLAATLFVFPALLTLLGTSPPRPLRFDRPGMGASFARLPVRYAGTVCLATLFLATVASLALPFVRFDPDPLNVRDPGAESVEAMNDLLASGSESPWTVEVLVSDLEQADRVAARLSELPEVLRAVTLSSFVPDEQQKKLETLEDLAFFMEPLHSPSARPEPSDAVQVQTDLARLHDTLSEDIAAANDDARLRSSLEHLREVSARLSADIARAADPDGEVARIERALVGDLPVWVEQMAEALKAKHITIEDLPASIRDRFVASDGRARVEVFPAGDLSKRGALQQFVDSVHTVVPDSAGAAVEIVESGRAIVVALRQALSGAVVVMTVLLIVLWRSVRETLLVLSALFLATVLTAATTVAIDVPLNFADVIVLPLLLGIGVDSGIHLVHRHRVTGGCEPMLGTSTARAILFSALTTIASFGTLALSSHRGIASLGILLTLGLSYMLVANLIFLPAFITWLDRANE